MKNNIRFRGRLRAYLYGPMLMTIFLLGINILIYFVDVESGIIIRGFIFVYFFVEIAIYLYAKPNIVSEIVNVATHYATVQKRLLEEFEIPYALLDNSGKILWINEQFSELTGINRN